MRHHVLLGSLLLSLTTASAAQAYTHRKANDGSDIRWKTDAVTVVADRSLARLDADPAGLATKAFKTWEGAHGAELPAIDVVLGDADDIGFRGDGSDQSTVRFAQGGWQKAGHALGVTVVTFDEQGKILDADIVLNGGSARPFGEMNDDGSKAESDDGEGAGKPYDALNVLTHESGHFFGLGESPDFPDATMFPTSARGETKKRRLSTDDVSGIASLYVPGSATDAPQAHCALGAGRSAGSEGVAAIGVAALALALLRRRRAAASLVAVAIAGSWFFASPAPSHASAPRVTVAVADARWESGLVVTRLELVAPSGEHTTVEVLGGRKDGVTQIVGHHDVPRAGDELVASFSGAKLVVRGLPLRADGVEP